MIITHTSKNDRNPDSFVNWPGLPPLMAGAFMSVRFGLARVNERPGDD